MDGGGGSSRHGVAGQQRPTPSTFGRLAGTRLSNAETPLRSASLRLRRGMPPSQPFELDFGLDDDDDDEQRAAARLAEEAAAAASESVQESTLRKRERIAELRRRREEQQQQQANGSSASRRRLTGGVRAALGTGFFTAPEAADESRAGSSSPDSDTFFESTDLALLLQPLEVAGIDALLEPPARTARTQPPRQGHRPGPLPLSARRGGPAADFTVSIPATSLSPVLPPGWARHGSLAGRNRGPRSAAPHGDSSDDDGAGGGCRHVDSAVAAQLDAELAHNRELHAELARLHRAARCLAGLVVASRRVAEASAPSRRE
ncbi:hypothetical protein GGI04_004368 [Coemansia thaxteri]|uniref:Uncharacterized protein n=1 Tax=Coemansia thaxteri TaxID=2663907 RepID=A0A9W8BLZ3_9FUNG|nr:hypothetical protein GGI04_004368 [Coemansia thaxteri]KAJ2007393.1 hypothetical protein H4R26_000816 [Coemansia thaxteri]KAJ2470550.1 hypothetical protein GGI02_002856 [Coemansia sp. RSA 2322]